MPTRYHVVWTQVAEKDLRSIIQFIAKGNPLVARKTLHSIRLKASLLYQYPLRGRYLPELAHIKGLPFRELVLSPWRLIYRIKEKEVEILGFFDSRRDLADVLYERLTRV